MKESFWGYLLILLGVVIIVILFLIQRLTTTNEEEYYLAREVMEAAMIDAVDYSALRGDYPMLIMSREKFVEIFTRRFAESITPDKSYQIDFYQIVEEPPCATVRIRSYTGESNVGIPNASAIDIAVDDVITAVLVMQDDDSVTFRRLNTDATDYDQSGTIDIEDIRMFIKHIDGTSTMANRNNELDLNGDGKVDYLDVASLEYVLYGRYPAGDVSMDNKVSAYDLTLYDRELNNTQKLLADVNNDGKIDGKDKNVITNYVNNYLEGKTSVSYTTVHALGDINRDGRINMMDYVYAQNYLNHEFILDTDQKTLGDVNKNGYIDKGDLEEIKKKVLGTSTVYKNMDVKKLYDIGLYTNEELKAIGAK